MNRVRRSWGRPLAVACCVSSVLSCGGEGSRRSGGGTGASDIDGASTASGAGGDTTATAESTGGAFADSIGNGMGGGADASGGGESTTGGGDGGGGSGAGGGTMNGELPPNAIAATASGTCALDADGTIHCWGAGEWQIPEGSFVELHSSPQTVCAVRSDRTVACFIHDPLPQPETPSGTYSVVSVGLGAICAVDTAGEIDCPTSSLVPQTVAEPTDTLVAISRGNYHACGISAADGTLVCWGSEGVDDCSSSPISGQLEAPNGVFVAVTARGNTSCAIDVDGNLACWGVGEAEDGSDDLCGEPNHGQAAPPSGEFKLVSLGANHGCAVRVDGTLTCWGAGTEDECPGNGIDCRQARPPDGVFEQVVGGVFHSCAMRADRTVACWGGEGGDEMRTTPPPEFQ